MTDRFLAYAMAFEEAFKSDDWSVVEPFFCEDAVYETEGGPPFGGLREGRDAVLAFMKQSLDEFDRRFDSREIELLEGPVDEGGSVFIKWAAIYRVAGAPELRLEGAERAYYSGDRISKLVDYMADNAAEQVMEFMQEHGEKLV